MKLIFLIFGFLFLFKPEDRALSKPSEDSVSLIMSLLGIKATIIRGVCLSEEDSYYYKRDKASALTLCLPLIYLISGCP
jgi:hypothetical protein